MKRLVIKIGSNILASAEQGLDTRRLRAIARDISQVIDMGHQVVMVSSGAVAAGLKKLGLRGKPRDIKLKQAAAAIGQSSLMWAYENSFADFDKKVAQVLLTRDDISNRLRYINAKNTLFTLMSYGVIPVINENDPVAVDEIKFGDNDMLAALTASLVEADMLIILSDVEGLYSKDPAQKGAKIIGKVVEITHEIEKLAGSSSSTVGTGGMYSKVLAARQAVNHGIPVVIMSGKKRGLLKKHLEGSETGTRFEPKKQRMSSKKGWIAYGVKSKGSIYLDEGAVKALTELGRSLLPSGIIKIEGDFEVGDSVRCVTKEGRKIAKGLTNYSSKDLAHIIGRKTGEIEQILGYKYSDEVIHRDNLVVI
ncbi:glutamate 5-kinase [candidate division WS5 bacterium]|uniref:Glutamate 5-kinase n=1 Tax=candidate division WS5 bacterium TaxID=2093353 RepID=A0A419DAP6_9BACT|nr:MAG: glutamate 5-kinase [candidate division WS5 bacterium]